MKLENGKTLLQQIDSEDGTYNLYYGNEVYEVKNGIEDRSIEGMTVPKDAYEQILDAFKQSDEFKQFDEYKEAHGGITTPQQPVQQSQSAAQNTAEIDEMSKQIDVLNKQIAALQQQLQTSSSMNAQLQQEVAMAREDEKRKVAEAEEKAKQALAQVQAKSESDEDDESDEEYGRPVIGGILQIFSIVVAVTTLAFCMFGMSKINGNVKTLVKQSSDTQASDTLTLTIDGESYEINASQIELQNGESSVAVYGLMTTNQNGEKVKKVIPLGEIKVENNASKNTESTENSTDSTDTNADNTENQ